MNKAFRQGQILKLIRNKRILTQEDLARELKHSQNIDTTQVTLSRDVRELGLLKTPEGYRQVDATSAGPDLAMVLGEFLQDVRAAQNLIVLKTSPGNANALAVALDNADWPEIVGTIAGDDTVLIVTPDTDTAGRLRKKLLGLYLALKSSQTATPMAAGSRNSAQSCHRLAHAMGFRSARGVSSRSEVDSFDRRLDGKPRMARTISSLPLRSAIRMVAELMPLVDCSSFLRSEGGTSATDR